MLKGRRGSRILKWEVYFCNYVIETKPGLGVCGLKMNKLIGRTRSSLMHILHLNQRNQRNQILFQYLRDKKKKKKK